MKSTFLKSGPNPIKELSNEDALKIFTYNKPTLMLFRDVKQSDFSYYDNILKDAFTEIEDLILVCYADINTAIG